MRIYTLALIFVLALVFNSGAQTGKLLIIGGGSENITSTTSWNYAAFNWAVGQSTNKKVAILHYATTTSTEFENYFKNSCGATSVKSFIVNSTGANNPTLVNEISEYDVFYLRGGDQWYYYSYWKGKLIEDAIHAKYNSGGVICGTSAGLAILSGTAFVAEYGDCYSNSAVKNYNLASITLRNDFLEMKPGFIFDSHFTNRGRMGRLVSFMANWKKNNSASLVGIGVDEITALAINADGNATAYGAGTVNIFRLRNNKDFGAGVVVNVDSLELTQLSHGKSINLNTFTVSSYLTSIEPEVKIERNPSKIYISGGDYLTETNIGLLGKFANEGSLTNPIIIFTGSVATLANDYKTKLNELGATNVKVYEAGIVNANNSTLVTDIQTSSKFLFINNTPYDFFNLFYNSDGTAGIALKDALKNRVLTLAFIGDNARFCGVKILGNYLSSSANANVSDGLGLIKTAVIIPKTYERATSGVTDYWHGTNAAIPYSLVRDKIKNGIWLNDDNYIVYKGVNTKAIITVFGTSPVFVLSQHNTKGELISQTSSGTGSPDKKGAFDFMYLSFLKENQEYTLGDYESAITSNDENIVKSSFKIYPNPVSNQLFIESEKEIQLVCIYDILGSAKLMKNFMGNEAIIDIEKLNLQKGLYLVEVRNWDDEKFTQKIIIK
jgi:cyanophycinase